MEERGGGGGVKILIFSFSGRYFWLLCVLFRLVWFGLILILLCFDLPNAFLSSKSHTQTHTHTHTCSQAALAVAHADKQSETARKRD